MFLLNKVYYMYLYLVRLKVRFIMLGVKVLQKVTLACSEVKGAAIKVVIK
jgi:hypothetical protein